MGKAQATVFPWPQREVWPKACNPQGPGRYECFFGTQSLRARIAPVTGQPSRDQAPAGFYSVETPYRNGSSGSGFVFGWQKH